MAAWTAGPEGGLAAEHGDPRARVFHLAACWAGAVVALAGGVVLLGWELDAGALESLVPGSGQVRPNPALAFLLIGASIVCLCLSERREALRWAAAGLAAGAGLIGLLTLSEHVLGWNLHIDALLFGKAVRAISTRPAPFPPGRMAPTTALSFLLVAVAVISRTVGRRRPLVAVPTVVLAIGFAAVLAYLYGEATFIVLNPWTTMGLQTGFVLVLSAGALLLLVAAPGQVITSSGPAGTVVRRMLPAAIVAIVALGYLLQLGVRVQTYDGRLALTLLSLGSAGILTAIAWATARSLHASERLRSAAEEALRGLNRDLEGQVEERTAAFAASEERFRAIATTANDAIVSVDEEGTIVYVNQAAEQTFGVDGDLVGQPVVTLIPERYRAAHREGMDHYRRTGDARLVGRSVEMAGLRGDGSEFPMELSLARWRTRDSAFFTAIMRDVTQRRRAEDVLRQRDALIEQSPVGICQLDPAGHVIDLNPAFEVILGRARRHLSGARLPDLLQPSHRERAEALLAALRTGQRRRGDLECQLLRGDGTLIWAFVVLASVVDAEGRPDGVMGMVEDISERRRQRDSAAAIQQRLVPRQDLQLPGYEIAGACSPAMPVAADLFDWVVPAPGVLDMTLADVTGKGMGGVLVMTALRAALRAAPAELGPAARVQAVAAAMTPAADAEGLYATLFHGRLDLASGRLRYVDAGHGYCVLARATGETLRLDQRSLPLGAGGEAELREGVLALDPGDAVVLYSDGAAPSGGDIAIPELAASVRDGAGAAELVDRVLARVPQQPDDDATVVVLRRLARVAAPVAVAVPAEAALP